MSNPTSTEVGPSTPAASSTPSTSKQASTEADSGVADASATPSTSGLPRTGVSTGLPDASATSSTSGQPPVCPPLSSIEVDPNNPPPETPSIKNEPVVKKDGEKKLTCRERLNIQLPLWQKHLGFFPIATISATTFSVCAIIFFIIAYSIDPKEIYLAVAFGCCAVCFTIVWLWIPAGPPFLSNKEGIAIQPAYLKPVYIDDDPSPEPVSIGYASALETASQDTVSA